MSEYLDIPREAFTAARKLDNMYIPTRYPDVWSEGTPMDYYTEAECREAISEADRLIRWVERTWESLMKGEG